MMDPEGEFTDIEMIGRVTKRMLQLTSVSRRIPQDGAASQNGAVQD